MFDPTAFDNMKVVLEGAVYDLDFIGKVRIVDRDDIVNLSKFSRKYRISFETMNNSLVTASIILQAELKNLAGELLPAIQSNELAGAQVKVQFELKKCPGESDNYAAIDRLLKRIWGDNRTTSYQLQGDPLNGTKLPRCLITLEFNRLILEENMDDLKEMAFYMVETANELRHFVHSSQN